MRALSIASRKLPVARPASLVVLSGLMVIAAVAAIVPSAGPARAGAAGLARHATAHRPLRWFATSLDWPAYLLGARHTSATTGPAAITPGNAGSLKAAWMFQEQPPTGILQPQGG